MLDWFKPKNDNEWTAADRRERRRMVATALLALLALVAGIGLLIIALTEY